MILEKRLQDLGVLITGASQGLGKAISTACVAQGAHVFLTARDTATLEAVASELRALAQPGQQVLTAAGDVASPAHAELVAGRAAAELPNFCGLVNNAGVWGPMGRLEDVPWEEWAGAIQTNLMGTALMCRFAIPNFRKHNYGKIVNLSGGGATAPMPRISAYAASKAAVVRFTETLALETRDGGIRVNAVAPGAMNTRMLDQLLSAGKEKVGDYYQRGLKQRDEGGASLERAASLIVFLLSRASDEISGRLISAVWDPWESLPERAGELAGTDVYTLRRIIPKERGLDWEE